MSPLRAERGFSSKILKGSCHSSPKGFQVLGRLKMLGTKASDPIAKKIIKIKAKNPLRNAMVYNVKHNTYPANVAQQTAVDVNERPAK
eukprot:Gb_00725 [translate_table: standard]